MKKILYKKHIFLFYITLFFIIVFFANFSFFEKNSGISQNSIEKIKNINSKYNASISSQFYQNKIGASLFQANLINQNKPQENKKIDALIRFKGEDFWGNIFGINIDSKDINSYIKEISQVEEIAFVEKNFDINLDSQEISFDSFTDKDIKSYFNNKNLKFETRISIIDSGIDLKNPIFLSKIISNTGEIFDGKDNDKNGYIDDSIGWNFFDGNNEIQDKNGHGSHLAGVISLNEKIKILPIKVVGDDGNGKILSLINALYYVKDKNIDIINLSLGTKNYSQFLEEAVNEVLKTGKIIVGASGNQNSDEGYYPAKFSNVLSVCALNEDLTKYSYSNFGDWVDFCYFGNGINSFGANGLQEKRSGTSQSASFITLFLSFYKGYEGNLVGYEDFLQKISFKNDTDENFKGKIGKAINDDLIINYISSKGGDISLMERFNIKKTFKDISGNKFQNEIIEIAKNKLISKAEKFYPEKNITKDEFEKTLSFLSKNRFSDLTISSNTQYLKQDEKYKKCFETKNIKIKNSEILDAIFCVYDMKKDGKIFYKKEKFDSIENFIYRTNIFKKLDLNLYTTRADLAYIIIETGKISN